MIAKRRPVFRVKYRNHNMTYSKVVRLKAMLPFIKRANNEGMTIPQAAEWMGWSESSIRNWIKVFGITWNKRRKRTGYRIDKTGWEEKIRKMVADNKSQEQIAATLRVGKWTISRYMSHNDIQPARIRRL